MNIEIEERDSQNNGYGYENPCENCPVNTKNGGDGICVCSLATLNLYR